MRTILAALLLASLAPAAHASEVRNFFAPQIAGARIDACLTGGACGKPAADAFCKAEGYDRAMIFQRERAEEARTIDSGKLCSGDCTTFKQVKCFTAKSDLPGQQASL